MSTKSARKPLKKSIKKVQSAKLHTMWFYIRTYFVSLFVLAIAATTVFQFLPQKGTDFCANSVSCVKDLTVKVENREEGTFNGQKVTPPQIDLLAAANNNKPTVLGETTSTGDKHIFIDLSAQRLYAFEGNTMKYNFLISSGKWSITPTGNFTIWVKLRSTRMTGGNPATGTYYNLPNVEFTMFFYNREHPKSEGYSTHTAYWHDNFGHPMSHGCINMRREDAKSLYDWATPPIEGYTTYATDGNPGTPITIYGVTPKE